MTQVKIELDTESILDCITEQMQSQYSLHHHTVSVELKPDLTAVVTAVPKNRTFSHTRRNLEDEGPRFDFENPTATEDPPFRVAPAGSS